ncbi:MAG: LL-diaminopimelate aminotransferase [Deltaproteobacteria bacterium]|jgi:LL-diaminopimelate aminotransferase|nr:LL-diaminopimelate aminotransferase [Deltaproteobacteria bacterium]
MALANSYYQNLSGSYLFSEIARRVNAFVADNPDKKVIRLGIGDVTSPLPPSVIAALRKAVDEQATAGGFRGYGPEQGYDFLRAAIVRDCFAGLGIGPDEVFVSDGAKCDLGNFQELFDAGCRVAITDPVYPVYADSNVMAGRGKARKDGKFEGMIYLPCTAENGFVPALPPERPDLVYLCYPNNPTGTVLTREQLKTWVDYARANNSVILYDAAYEAFISTPGIPRSIYEIPGAHEVAVEFRSYSKTAGFTGLRCGYVVVPTALKVQGAGAELLLRELWLRRQTTKYNGCPYIVQRGAEAVHSPAGKAETGAIIAKYMANARLIRTGFASVGLEVYGGVDAPYLWLRLPRGLGSWDFFDKLLTGANIVGTPGAGFGPSGEGYFRLTGFNTPENTLEAVERLKGFKI